MGLDRRAVACIAYPIAITVEEHHITLKLLSMTLSPTMEWIARTIPLGIPLLTLYHAAKNATLEKEPWAMKSL